MDGSGRPESVVDDSRGVRGQVDLFQVFHSRALQELTETTSILSLLSEEKEPLPTDAFKPLRKAFWHLWTWNMLNGWRPVLINSL